MKKSRMFPVVASAMLLGLALLAGGATADDKAMSNVSSVFAGAKVNGGTVTHLRQGNLQVLTLSADFKSPETPDPHWQVVDSKGTVYLLQRLPIKGDRINTTITLPPYIHDVAKVQIWCAYAEALLGEASFAKPVM